jgi:hypothetical protein
VAVTTETDSTPQLPLPLLTRTQEAQVATAEANARKAAADAEASALAVAQSKYKSLVPDLTGLATNAVNDKSADVAFGGLVTYSALNHAAEIVVDTISRTLRTPAGDHHPTILVTAQSDLLTNDLLSIAVVAGLKQTSDFADAVLKQLSPAAERVDSAGDGSDLDDAGLPKPQTTSFRGASTATAVASGALGAAAFGPVGFAAAAASAIPSIVSLFSSTTTVKSQVEVITDLATTTSIVSAVSEKLPTYTAVHEDFRFAPPTSAIRHAYEELTVKRIHLVLAQEREQVAKNAADLDVARAQQQLDAGKKATPPKPDDPALTKQLNDATLVSANAAAALTLISAVISSIDGFSTLMNATAAGTRSPLATASLNELLHSAGADGISYVLSVKGLGGESEEYTKDRRIGHDTYTTLADASISFMLFDTTAKKIISSGVATGVSSVHGRLGDQPAGNGA